MPMTPGFAMQGENPLAAIFARQRQQKTEEDALHEEKKRRKQELALGIANLIFGGGGVGSAAGQGIGSWLNRR